MATPDLVMRQWFQSVWNAKADAAIDQLMTEDAVCHGLGPEPIVGRDGFRPVVQALVQAIPDLDIEVVRTVTEGDLIATHIRSRGHHTGAGLGGPPTNRRVEFDGMVITRVRDGQIAEGWNCIDFLSLYQQLGWVPVPVTPGAGQ